MSKMLSNPSIAIAAGAVSTLCAVGTACASQGPGIASGTASGPAQLAMAIIVYGGSALLIAWGVIGAVRHR
ncbi:MAG: hypothetical protein JWQ94_75 [Tardiphaga sp.]|jgi:hypothetical protein|nr:hypothetical protein [Tardiphaga sp.]